jgi:hypothetical protein
MKVTVVTRSRAIEAWWCKASVSSGRSFFFCDDILRKVAVNENNCRVISNTEGLLSKTMAHLTSDKLHGDHHAEWSIIAEESLEFVYRLLATLGTTKLTSEISSSSQAIMGTLGCHKCDVVLKRQAAEVLLHLPLDTPPSIVPGASGSESISIIFVWNCWTFFFCQIAGSTVPLIC